MLPSDMPHDDKNEHRRNQGKPRLAIRSRRNHSRCSLPANDSSRRNSTSRHRIVGVKRFRNKTRVQDKFPRTTSRSTETASPEAHFLIANARLKLTPTHRKTSPLKISNRERIAFSHRHSPTHSTRSSAHHSSLITRHFFPNRNSRFTGFHLTPLATILTQFLTATNTRFCRTQHPQRLPPRCLLLTTRLHHFSFHGIIGLLCSQ